MGLNLILSRIILFSFFKLRSNFIILSIYRNVMLTFTLDIYYNHYTTNVCALIVVFFFYLYFSNNWLRINLYPKKKNVCVIKINFVNLIYKIKVMLHNVIYFFQLLVASTLHSFIFLSKII